MTPLPPAPLPRSFDRPARQGRRLRALSALAAAVGLAALAACSSSPRVQFHSLMDTAVTAPRPTGTAPFAFRIESPVRVPAQVDQPQMVLRTASGEVRLQEYQRWVAPLTDEWRDALADGLVRRSGALDASRVPAPAGLARFDLRLELQRFDAVPGGEARQQVAWSVHEPQGTRPLMSCLTEVSQPAPTDVPGVVAAQRAATQAVATVIAGALQSLQAGRTPACP